MFFVIFWIGFVKSGQIMFLAVASIQGFQIPNRISSADSVEPVTRKRKASVRASDNIASPKKESERAVLKGKRAGAISADESTRHFYTDHYTTHH
jgi:hypothetical protein